MLNKIQIVGCGFIGEAVLDALLAAGVKPDDLKVVESNPNRLSELVSNEAYEGVTFTAIVKKDADVYIVCVRTTQQVREVLNDIPWKSASLVVVESTVDPDAVTDLYVGPLRFAKLVFFPHRWNPNDPEHAVFNLVRCIGGASVMALRTAGAFYEQFMDQNLIRIGSPYQVTMAKVLENAYRYAEIVIAQEFKRMFDARGEAKDWPSIRNLANSKWNIDIREAMTGVKGECLTFAIDTMLEKAPDGRLFAFLKLLNDEYIAEVQVGDHGTSKTLPAIGCRAEARGDDSARRCTDGACCPDPADRLEAGRSAEPS